MNSLTSNTSSHFEYADSHAKPISPSQLPAQQQQQQQQQYETVLDSDLLQPYPFSAQSPNKAVSSNTNTVGENAGRSRLDDCIATASPSERALGIRVALADKNLREWLRELGTWPWPRCSSDGMNGFRPWPSQKHYSATDLPNDPLHAEQIIGGLNNSVEEPFWGSIPAQRVQMYEDRIEVIKKEMDTLELEDLKDFVRAAHSLTGSKHQSRFINSSNGAEVYNSVDEFTAIITTTIVQVLPTISALNILISLWSSRLFVLRQVPQFVELLAETQRSLANAWTTLGIIDLELASKEPAVVKETLHAEKSVIENRIFELGRRLDIMLDTLEDREDTVPEEWIDEMEQIEGDFVIWIAEMERRLVEIDLKTYPENEPQMNHASTQEKHFEGLRRDSTGSSQHEDKRNGNRDQESKESVNTEIPSAFDAFGPKGHTLSGKDGQEEVQNNESSAAETSSPVTHGDNNLPLIERFPKPRSLDNHRHSRTYSQEADYVAQDMSLKLKRPNKPNQISNFPKPKYDILQRGDTAQDSPTLGMTGEISRTYFGPHSKANRIENDGAVQGELGSPLKQNSEVQSTLDATYPARISPIPESQIEVSISQSPTSYFPHMSPSSGDNLKISQQIHKSTSQSHGPRPAPLVFEKSHLKHESRESSETSSDNSQPGSGTSDYFSNMSSPEIQQASMAEYYENPVEVTTPSRGPSTPLGGTARHLNQRMEQTDFKWFENAALSNPRSSPSLPIKQRRRASSFAPESTILETTSSSQDSSPPRPRLRPHMRVRSASLRSFEVIPRNEVRNITISRKGSYSATAPGLDPAQPDSQRSESLSNSNRGSLEQQTAMELSSNGSKLVIDHDNAELPPKKMANSWNTLSSVALSSPVELSEQVPVTPHQRNDNLIDLSPGTISSRLSRRRTADLAPLNTSSPSGASNPLRDEKPEDQLEARISSILSDIPEHIRLTSGPGPGGPEIHPRNSLTERKRPMLQLPAMKLVRAQTSLSSTPHLLRPTHTKPSLSRSQTGEPEIKLYHLHSSGKEAPIKLFVRLVGESGERVMVRIGGGWADLGEYLKEYASHHGRRSISDGRFKLEGMPSTQPASPASIMAGFSTSRPGSSSGKGNSPAVFRPQPSSPCSPSELEMPMTPDNLPIQEFGPTPESIGSSSPSLRPFSRHSLPDEESPLGLAGPNAKKKQVSPDKKAWVDGMLNQARRVSGDRKKETEAGFGDLGKVGGTRRLFMKARKDG